MTEISHVRRKQFFDAFVLIGLIADVFDMESSYENYGKRKGHLQEHDNLKEISKVLELDHFRAP